MNKDSRLPAEFDITDQVRWGETNRVTAVVIQYSDATFVEDQDHWRLGGIHREVYLRCCPNVHLEDVFARGDFDPESRESRLDLDIRVGMRSGVEAGWQIKWQVVDALQAPVMEAETVPVESERARLNSWPRVGCRIAKSWSDLSPWSAEVPTRYRLLLSLISPDGEEVEATSVWIGFRRVEIKNREVRVNVKAVMFHGVNRHEHSDMEGKHVPEALLRKDLEVMKAHNINAIRTSHYPDDVRFYDLCDEYGFYVIDEANIESHDFHNQICHDKRYLNAFVERGARMVHRDKNHPCIVVDTVTGLLTGLFAPGGGNLLSDPVRFTLWRAPTDNDGIKSWTGQDNKPLGRWRDAGLEQLVVALDSMEQTDEGCVLIWSLSTQPHEDAGE